MLLSYLRLNSGTPHERARHHTEPSPRTKSRNRPGTRILLQSGGLPNRSGHDLVPRLAVRGSRLRGVEPGELLDGADRRVSGRRPARPRRRIARLPQHLPASRIEDLFRGARDVAAVGVSLSSMDLRTRRAPDCGARHGRGIRKNPAGLETGPLREHGGLYLDLLEQGGAGFRADSTAHRAVLSAA